MKKYIYTVTLEDGSVFDYPTDTYVTFNHKDEKGKESSHAVVSMIFCKSVDELVVEAEDEQIGE